MSDPYATFRRASPMQLAIAHRARYDGRAEDVEALRAILVDVMWDPERSWDGNVNLLDELAPCICCCNEHTFDSCLARLWYGCRGQGSMTRADIESWAKHYEEHHGMTRDQFYGLRDE